MLNNTTVKRWDGTRCYYPNALLNAQPLINLSRSENKVEAFKVRMTISPLCDSRNMHGRALCGHVNGYYACWLRLTGAKRQLYCGRCSSTWTRQRVSWTKCVTPRART